MLDAPPSMRTVACPKLRLARGPPSGAWGEYSSFQIATRGGGAGASVVQSKLDMRKLSDADETRAQRLELKLERQLPANWQ